MDIGEMIYVVEEVDSNHEFDDFPELDAESISNIETAIRERSSEDIVGLPAFLLLQILKYHH